MSTAASKIVEALAPKIVPSAPVALFDYPDHKNAGDSAIWMGTVKLFSDLMPRRLISREDLLSTSFHLPEFPRDTVIVLSGGGNFGELYPHIQAWRERLIGHYAGHRIVQLPQSVHFWSQNAIERVGQICRAHSDFHFLGRDAASVQWVRGTLGLTATLAPDVAMCLCGTLERFPAQQAIVALLRDDQEGLGYADMARRLGIPVTDWPADPAQFPFSTSRWLGRLYERWPRRLASLRTARRPLFDRMAGSRLQAACSLLSRGRCVISDRLHAHILCDVLGIDHVVLDNSYGKVSGYVNTWDPQNSRVLIAKDFETALLQARELGSREMLPVPEVPN